MRKGLFRRQCKRCGEGMGKWWNINKGCVDDQWVITS